MVRWFEVEHRLASTQSFYLSLPSTLLFPGSVCLLSVPNTSLDHTAFILESTYHQQPAPYAPRSCTHRSTTMALQAHTMTCTYTLMTLGHTYT